jgi:hypothetical protein
MRSFLLPELITNVAIPLDQHDFTRLVLINKETGCTIHPAPLEHARRLLPNQRSLLWTPKRHSKPSPTKLKTLLSELEMLSWVLGCDDRNVDEDVEILKVRPATAASAAATGSWPYPKLKVLHLKSGLVW